MVNEITLIIDQTFTLTDEDFQVIFTNYFNIANVVVTNKNSQKENINIILLLL